MEVTGRNIFNQINDWIKTTNGGYGTYGQAPCWLKNLTISKDSMSCLLFFLQNTKINNISDAGHLVFDIDKKEVVIRKVRIIEG